MSEELINALADSLHDAYEWQYDDCDHGTYSGGMSHGQPYEMCNILARRILSKGTVFSEALEEEFNIPVV